MKINKSDIRKMVEESLTEYMAAQMPEDDEEILEDDDESILTAIKDLCGDGMQYFYSIRAELENSSYVSQNAEKFAELVKKVEDLCQSMEELLYYAFK